MSLVEEALKRRRAAASAGNSGGFVPEGPAASAHDAYSVANAAPAPLDREFLVSEGYSLISDKSPTLLSQFRMIKRRVLEVVRHQQIAGNAASIAITSAAPGDGKSFVTLNLAYALSLEKPLRTYIVDYDPYQRRTSRMFGLDSAPGLLDQLAASGSPAPVSAAHSTDIPRLNVLSAGLSRNEAPELLCSSAFDSALSAMRATGSHSIFLFDCPPVLATANAAYLAPRVDLTIFVVRAGVTSRHAVREALDRLGGSDRVAFVLNAKVGSIAESYYGYSQNYESYQNG